MTGPLLKVKFLICNARVLDKLDILTATFRLDFSENSHDRPHKTGRQSHDRQVYSLTKQAGRGQNRKTPQNLNDWRLQDDKVWNTI